MANTYNSWNGLTDAQGSGATQNWAGGKSGFRNDFSTAVSTAPGAPTAVAASPRNASAEVSWTAPVSSGSGPITSYIVTASTGGSQTMASGGFFTGLTNGVAVTFTVQAVNFVGAGPASAASNSVTPSASASAPDAPTIGTAVAGNATAVITWTDNGDGGSPITSYNIVSSPATTTQHFSSGGTFTGLANGTAYTFTVAAVNGVGASAASSATNSVTPSTVPSAPTAVAGTSGVNTASVITWTDGATGGSPITSYNIVSSPATTTQHFSSGGTFTGLTNGTSYTFTVTAVNANGAGAASSASGAVVPSTVPAAPTIGTATAVTSSTATVTYTDNGTGGSAITSHAVVSSPATSTQNIASGGTFTGLSASTSYTFTVAAINANGTGAASSASNSITTPSSFTPPTDTTFLSNTVAGAGADNRTTLANWLTVSQGSTQALNATNYLGSSNASNTLTGVNANNTGHLSTSGLISASGWKTLGCAAKQGSGTPRYVSLWSNGSTSNYATFDLQAGTVVAQAGTATGAIFSGIGNGFYWCRVTLATGQGANATANVQYGATQAGSQPGGAETIANTNTIILGPFACTT